MAINSYPEIEVDKLPTPGDDMPGVKDIITSGYITDEYTHSGTIDAGLYKIAIDSEDYVGIGATFIFSDNNLVVNLDGIINFETSVRLTTSESNFKIMSGFQNSNLTLNLATSGSRIVYGNGWYMSQGAGTSGNAILRKSKDGVNWSIIPSPALAIVSGVAQQGLDYANDRWYVFGNTALTVAQSTNDGMTWTTVASPAGAVTTTTFFSAAFTTGNYVMTGNNNGNVSASHSTDGVTWTTKSLGQAMRDVIFAEGTFVAGGDNGAIYTSTNGVTWTSRTSGVGGTIQTIVHDGSKFFAPTTTEPTELIQSTDGITWSKVDLPFFLYNVRDAFAAAPDGSAYYAADEYSVWYTTTPTSANSWIRAEGGLLQSPYPNTNTTLTYQGIRGLNYANNKFFISHSVPATGLAYPNKQRGVSFRPTNSAVSVYVYSTDLTLKDN